MAEIPRYPGLANTAFPDLVNLVWNAADRPKHWHAYGPALRVLARLILAVDVEPCPHGEGEVPESWDVDAVPGRGLDRLWDETAGFYEWAENQRSLWALERLANRGEPPSSPPAPGDDCPTCAEPLELRCLTCGWTTKTEGE